MSLAETERVLRITRIFDAPRELVFKVWTTPETMLRWWGPKLHPATQMQMDVRPGGKWRDGHQGGWSSMFDRLAEFLAAGDCG